MVAEVFAGLGSIKAAFDIAKGLKDIDDATRRNTAIIELQEKTLSAQAEQSELIETIGDLKKRVTELETWEAEKQRYELKDIGTGRPAYEESKRNAEPPHQICAACYQNGKKSLLQPSTSMYSKHLICPECKTDLIVG